jgi:hypothetical protein
MVSFNISFGQSNHPEKFSLEDYHQASKLIEDEENELNKALASSNLNLKYIEESRKKVSEALKNLENFIKVLKEQNEKRSKSCFSFSRRKVIIINLTALFGTVLANGSNAWAGFSDGLTAKITGYSLGLIGSWAAYGAEAYFTKVSLNQDDDSKLKTLSQEGIQQGILLNNVLEYLRKIEEQNRDKRKEEIIPDSIVINIDPPLENTTTEEDLTNFLQAYDKLKHKSDDVYFKIVPVLIKNSLPDENPLKQTLQNLETYGKMGGSSQSLPVNYLESSNPTQLSKKSKWEAEELGELEEKDKESPSIQKNYQDYWSAFNQEFTQRLKIGKYITHLDIGKARLTPKGVIQEPSYSTKS